MTTIIRLIGAFFVASCLAFALPSEDVFAQNTRGGLPRPDNPGGGNGGGPGGGDGGGGHEPCDNELTGTPWQDMFAAPVVLPRPDPAGGTSGDLTFFGRAVVASQITDRILGGITDPIVLAVSSRPSRIFVYLLDPANQGRPTPVQEITTSTTSSTRGWPLVMADLNDDGIPDLVWGHGGSAPVLVYMGTVDGSGQLSYPHTASLTHPTLQDAGFGRSLAATGEYVVVGGHAFPAGGNLKFAVGEVAVYRTADIIPGNHNIPPMAVIPGAGAGDEFPGAGDEFGLAVALGTICSSSGEFPPCEAPNIEVTTLVVGAPYVDGAGRKNDDVGEAWVFDLQNSEVGFRANPQIKDDRFGSQVAVAGGLVVVANTSGSSSTHFAKVYDQGNNEVATLEPDQNLSKFWASGGIAVGNVNGTGTPLDIMIGAPDAECGLEKKVGVSYLYLDGSETNVISFQPPLEDIEEEIIPRVFDANRFGQANAIVDGFVIIGEPWRDDNQEAGAGQVYIYEYCQGGVCP